MESRQFIYNSDARWSLENTFRALFLRFREVLGLTMILYTCYELYANGLDKVNPLATAVTLTFGSIGVFIFILAINKMAGLRARELQIEKKEIELDKLNGVMDINEKNLKLYERELRIKQSETKIGITGLGDFEVKVDEDGTTYTTEAAVQKMDLSPDMIFQTLETQRQKEQKGLEWKDWSWWAKYGKGEYRKIEYNQRKEFFKFYVFEHKKWRKNNAHMNPSFSPTQIDLTNA